MDYSGFDGSSNIKISIAKITNRCESNVSFSVDDRDDSHQCGSHKMLVCMCVCYILIIIQYIHVYK